MNLPRGISVRSELKPGDIGAVIWMHGVLYAQEQGWDHTFEAYVAGPLSEFAKRASARQRIWLAEREEKIVGCIALVEVSPDEAQLRWLLIDPNARGLGLGKLLVGMLIKFAETQGYKSIFLWTVSSLTAAAGLYQEFGFRKTVEQSQLLWGADIIEERYDLFLSST